MSPAEAALWLVVAVLGCILAARLICWFVGLFEWWRGWNKEDPYL